MGGSLLGNNLSSKEQLRVTQPLRPVPATFKKVFFVQIALRIGACTLLFWILVVLQITTGIVAGEASIRKTAEGEATLHALSKAGFFFLRWRAYADYKKELLGLQKLFGIAAIIFSVMFFALGKTAINNTPFAVLPGLFIFLWMAVQFGTNFKKSVREQLNMVGILVIGPWGIYLLDYLTKFQFHQVQLLVRPLAMAFGFTQLSDFLATVLMSGMSVIIGLVMAGFSIIIFSMIPLFFLFLMAATSVLSRRALTVSPNAAYNASALYFFIIGPLLIALENKALI